MALVNTSTRITGNFCLSKLALISALALVTTACSTVTSYQKPVSDFAAATTDAATALAEIDKKTTKVYDEALRNEINNGTRLLRQEGCQLTSERCQLIATNMDRESAVFPPESVLNNIVTLMLGVTAYSQGLNEIVTADTAAKVAASVNATLGSVESFSKTVGGGAAPTVSAYKEPGGKAINWIFSQRIARLQINGLQQATTAAQPVISQVATTLEATASLAEDMDLAPVLKQFDAAWEKYEEDPTESNLNTAIAKAAASDMVLRTRPSSVFAALNTAHESLTQSLNGEGVSVIEVMAKIELFAEEAANVAAIIRELDKANNKSEGG